MCRACGFEGCRHDFGNAEALLARQVFTRDRKETKHPLGIELIVNCANCGQIVQSDLCNNSNAAFSQQILITVEKCKCQN